MSGAQGRGPRILLVEDDVTLASMLSDALRARSYEVWHVERGGDAEAALDQMHADVILLDLVLPDHNGLLLCARLKARADVPVIICSATRRTDDAAIGLQLGADDFLRKPFSLDELQERIDLALRRGRASAARLPRPSKQVERLGALTVDRAACLATVGDTALHLTPTEFRLLSALVSRAGEVLSRHKLAECIWDSVDDGVLRSLDVHMRRLRAKVAAAAGSGPYLVTRRGFGYQLVHGTDEQRPG
jgi:DNA-binding response OmpR family regulator